MDCGHVPCPDCGWCACWRDDPAGNTPPVPIEHHEWHGGLPVGHLAELAHAPAPQDGDVDPEDVYEPHHSTA